MKHVRGNSFGNEKNRKLVNKLIDEVNKANNISYKGGVRSTKNNFGTNVFIPRQKNSASILTATITQGISYTGESKYKATISGVENVELKGFALSETGYSVTEDFTTVARWFYIGDIVPVMKYDGDYYFIYTFTPLQNSDGNGSTAWHETERRLMSIFRDEDE